MAFNWTCPHCNTPQAVTDARYDLRWNYVGLDDQSEGKLALEQEAIGCANPDCGKTTMHVRIGGRKFVNSNVRVDDSAVLFDQTLIPQGSAKPQPDYVPEPLREDYYEACLIRDLSPKASATLTRRCIQGMIRDFAKITKGTLAKEIEALREAVDDGSADRAISIESVDAIDQVRGIGNIGAHMEKDINLVVEVDPGEAQALIELVEMLFEEWYGSRHRRQARLEHIAQIAEAKNEAKNSGAAQPTAGEAPANALAIDFSALQNAVKESLAPAAAEDKET